MSQFIADNHSVNAVAKHRHAPERRIVECEDATKDLQDRPAIVRRLPVKLAVAAAVVFRGF